MRTFLQMAGLTLLPVLCAFLLSLLFRRGKAQSKKAAVLRQVLAGVLFGLVAVCNTEFGVPVAGAVMNVRDAAPLCAGLFFGGPAGILAGVIGGVERYLAAFWGAGEYTRLACSIATVLAGVFGALARRFVLSKQRPAWYHGFAVGLIMETVHMLMIFFTNTDDVRTAFGYVEACTLPMLLCNSLAVGLAGFAVRPRRPKAQTRAKEKPHLSQTFQRWLFACIVVAFCATGLFTYTMQNEVSRSETASLLALNIADVQQEIASASDENLLALTREVAALLEREPYAGDVRLAQIAKELGIAEINIIDENGVIVTGTNAKFWNYDMASGEQSAEFLTLLAGETEYVQSYQPTSSDPNLWRKYAGVALAGGGFVQIGYDAEQFQRDIDRELVGVTDNRRVGENGLLLVCNAQGMVVSDRGDSRGKTLGELGLALQDETAGALFSAEVEGTPAYCMYGTGEGYSVVGVLPQSEAVFGRNMSVYLLVFTEVLIFAALFLLLYILIKRLVVRDLHRVNRSLAKITDGNLDEVVDVRSSAEFDALSNDINETVGTLKRYIAEASARIDRELEYAKRIQFSALPQVFPPYPDRRDTLDLYARMDAAKEVGGDFYDFFLLGDDRLAFLIADVSGKGIPAAMFMMTAKTLIKGLAEAGNAADDIFTKANEKLCRQNDAEMFVTAWLGILNLKTGVLEYVNAGHNPPYLLQGGTFRPLSGRHGFVLAGLSTVRYKKETLRLQPGDGVFLYTDGVTEAENGGHELYGTGRLARVLQANREASAKDLCAAVRRDVDAFAAGAPQFDDITMLYLHFLRREADDMAQRTLDAKIENIEAVTDFVNAQLQTLNCPQKAMRQIDVAIDELFSNIARYAYRPDVGPVTVRVEVVKDPLSVVLTFIDRGKPFDPLQAGDPDITKDADEREIGGLGLFIVRNSMDEITYTRENGQNILRIRKDLEK